MSPNYTVEIDKRLSSWQLTEGVSPYEHRDVPLLDSVAVLNDEGRELTIFAVNKDVNGALDFICDLRGFGDFKVVEHLVLAHPDLKATNTADVPDRVVPHPDGGAQISGTTVKASLPKLSWNVIRFAHA